MKMVSLSALYPPENIPGTHFSLEAELTPGPQKLTRFWMHLQHKTD